MALALGFLWSRLLLLLLSLYRQIYQISNIIKRYRGWLHLHQYLVGGINFPLLPFVKCSLGKVASKKKKSQIQSKVKCTGFILSLYHCISVKIYSKCTQWQDPDFSKHQRPLTPNPPLGWQDSKCEIYVKNNWGTCTSTS